jgi:hypothetical protein
MVELNIIPYDNLKNLSVLVIIREPIERLISICNCEYKHPNHYINRFKNNFSSSFQTDLLPKKYDVNLTSVKFGNGIEIKKFFAKFDINYDPNIKSNVSNKKFTIDDISKEDIEFLKTYYKNDYILYNNAL